MIVGNDGGGTIFDGIEVAQVASQSAMTRVQLTPHTIDYRGARRGVRWEYVRATTRSELDTALLAPISGPQIVEVPLDR